MTNLEWIRTLSAEELADWFYNQWLHRLQYRWSSSEGGLVVWLNEQRAEQTEPHIVGKHADTIIVDDSRLTAKCLNCANGGSYKCSKCDGEMYFKTEPQTDDIGVPWTDCQTALDEPQTERRCGNCKFLTYRFTKVWCDIKCDNPHDVVCDKWAERSE